MLVVAVARDGMLLQWWGVTPLGRAARQAAMPRWDTGWGGRAGSQLLSPCAEGHGDMHGEPCGYHHPAVVRGLWGVTPCLVPHTLLLSQPQPILLEVAMHGDGRALSHVPAMEQLWGQRPVPVWVPMVLPAMPPSPCSSSHPPQLGSVPPGSATQSKVPWGDRSSWGHLAFRNHAVSQGQDTTGPSPVPEA